MTLLQTGEFEAWIDGLRDRRARLVISERLLRMEQGNFGDVSPVGDGVSEARIHYGPGYRLYFVQRGKEVIILLCGGNKGSQRRDIERAKQLAASVKEGGLWR